MSMKKSGLGYIVDEQWHWTIETYDTTTKQWEVYWGVSTWTNNRKAALAKACRLIANWKRNTKGRWRLVFKECERFPNRSFYITANGVHPIEKAAMDRMVESHYVQPDLLARSVDAVLLASHVGNTRKEE